MDMSAQVERPFRLAIVIDTFGLVLLEAMRHCWRESSLRLASLLAIRPSAGGTSVVAQAGREAITRS